MEFPPTRILVQNTNNKVGMPYELRFYDYSATQHWIIAWPLKSWTNGFDVDIAYKPGVVGYAHEVEKAQAYGELLTLLLTSGPAENHV